MAASMKVSLRKIISYSRLSALQRGTIYSCSCRSKSSSSKNEDIKIESPRVPQVGMSMDGRTLISWHPEPTHPYHHTRPIDHASDETRRGDSVLKEQVLRGYETRFRKDGPNMAELSNITYTTKHEWYPRSQKKFKKRDPPKDRDGI